ncbi:MAG: CHAT domain-containing protein [Candidatus Lokiarchaeota archaeon]|nr:CHAT domain-containing protein [Candidatus Lokiarchaeota archaeon]
MVLEMNDKSVGLCNINFNDNELIDQISTKWMNTDFISPIDVIEEFELIIDDKSISLKDFSNKGNILIVNQNNFVISRSIKEHDVFPYPEILLKIINNDNKRHEVKFNWRLKSKTSYALVNERLSELYTDYKQEYLFFILIPSFLTRKETSLSVHSIEGLLEPGESDEIHVSMFFLRNFIETLGFSGLGFLIDKNDEIEAIAALGTNIFGKLETNNFSFPIHSLFSPIFWMENGKIPNLDSFIKTIEKSPIKKLLTFQELSKTLESKINQLGVDIIKIEPEYNCKTIDIQVTIDKLLHRKPFYDELALMPDDIITNLSLAPIFARFGAKMMVYEPKRSVKNIKKINPSNIIIIGDSNEIPTKVEKKLKDRVVIRNNHPYKERIVIYQMIFLTKYVVNNLILREKIDPEDQEWEWFLEKLNLTPNQVMEKYVNQYTPLDYNELHTAETAINGPQMIILSTATADGWQNAAIGANYAKSRNTVSYILEGFTENEKREISYLLKDIDNNLLNYQNLIEDSKKLGMIIGNKVPNIALAFSENIILFLKDASIPFELMFFEGRFGLESISTRHNIGRIVGDDIFDTAVLATNSILYSSVAHPNPNILLIGNPTQDLEFSSIETASIAALLNYFQLPYTFLSGSEISTETINNLKTILVPKGFEVNENSLKDLEKPTKVKFIKNLKNSNIVHFSGHGGIDKDGPFLVLNDGLFRIHDIPRNLERNPLIFANACLAGLSINYSGNVSIASKFIESGAIGYIGALWRVSDVVSSLLGSIYYEYLNYVPIGSVLKLMKELCFSIVPDDYTPLAFILSGDPCIHIFDPFYKSIEAFHYLRYLNDTINSGLIKKASECYSRTIRAFDIFNKELKERKRIKPEYSTLYNQKLLNFEAVITNLSANLEISRINQKSYEIELKGDWNVYKEIGDIMLNAAKKVKDASNIALEKGTRINYRMNSDYFKQMGLIFNAIAEYFSENYDLSLEILKKAAKIWDKSGKKLDKTWEEFEDGFIPIDRVDNQREALACFIVGWNSFIEGMKELSGLVRIDIIIEKADKAIQEFEKVLDIGDVILRGVAISFLIYILHNYSIVLVNSRYFDKAEIILTYLRDLTNNQINLLKQIIDSDNPLIMQQIDVYKGLVRHHNALKTFANGLKHLNNFYRQKLKDDKDKALELINKAINTTENEYFKNKWQDISKNI